MDFIIADKDGMEIDILKERQYIDMDIGGANDFEIHISNKLYKQLGICEGWRIGVPGKEYGGVIDRVKTDTSGKTVALSGPTWRGMLTKKIIEPPAGQDYQTVSGEANTIINNIMCVEFDGIFVCSGASGIMLDSYKFDRYVDHLAGIEKMLLSKNARLNIAYDSGEPNVAGFVRLSAVPIHDYSDELEYSKDGTLSFLSFSFERFKGGINHLICLGKGNLKDRLVIHLYVQEDGTIGNTKYYRGTDERTSVYDYSSCESAEELQEKGIERLKELMSYTNMDMDLFNKSLSGMRGNAEDISIGDIVGGRDWDRGIYLSKQITRKIVAVKDGRESIEYKVGGNTLNRSTANAPAEPEDAYQKQIDALNDGLTKNTSDISENAENISKNISDIQTLSTELSKKQETLNKTDDSSDINTMFTNGYYWINPGAHANTPFNAWGMLHVLRGNTQIFITYSTNDSRMVSRIYANGAWTPWAYSDGSLISNLDRPLSKYKIWQGVATVGADGRINFPWSGFGRTTKTPLVFVSSSSPSVAMQYAYDDSTSTHLQIYCWHCSGGKVIAAGQQVRLCVMVIN